MSETKNQFSDAYHESLSIALQFGLDERNKLSKLIMDARVSLLGLMVEVRSHEAKHGKSQKTRERMGQYESIMNALDESARLDNDNYTMQCVNEHLIGQRNKYYQECVNLQKQLKAVEESWNAM